MNPAERLIIALDLPDPQKARILADRLSDTGAAYKIGLELFLAGGPSFVAEMTSRHRIFLDLKFHDIPSTVAAAVKAPRPAAQGKAMIDLLALLVLLAGCFFVFAGTVGMLSPEFPDPYHSRCH
ncbi:MAG: orotidine 5'-phosphate decarboxylase / HUMPS family protein [Bacillota bacterium]